jgi:aminopeptidase N
LRYAAGMREFALPGTRASYPPDRRCAVRHYRLELDVDVDARRIAGTATVTLESLVAGNERLRLDAVELEVREVRRDGTKVGFTNDGRSLWIEAGALAIGQRLELDIDYATTPRRGLYFVGPDEGYPDKPVQIWSQGQDEDSRYWFPCLDTPSEKATSEVIATLPADFFALSNGDLLSDSTSGGRRTLHWRFDVPHACYLVTLAAGRLAATEDRAGDIALAYYCEPGREADCRRTLGRTPEVLKLLGDVFGVPYPSERYSQVFVADFIFGGMENTTATTLSDTFLYDERASLDYEAEYLVAHELAHQWFGDLLTCRTWGEGWLNEGFATYAEYLWREHAHGRDEADLHLEEWALAYFGEDAGRYRRVIATNVYDEPIDIFDHHLYEKGGRVLHMLRLELGDEAFRRAIKHYIEKHRVGSVETRDLARAVEASTGRNVEWFFEQWVTKGAGHPELDISYSWDPERRLAGFSIRQTQKVDATTPLFRLPVHVELRAGGETLRRVFLVTEAQSSFYVACAAEPSLAIVDPGKTLLAASKVEKPAPLWLAELKDAALALDRRDAATQLGKLGGAQATAALAAALTSDAFWGVRAASADALAGMRTQAARDTLIAALAGERHPKARRAIVRALGSFRGDVVAAEALIPVIERGDPSYFVEAEACLSLARTRTSRAFDVLSSCGGRESFSDVIRQYVFRGMAELRDERAVPVLTEAIRYGNHSQGRRAALLGLADLCRGRRDIGARDARERSEELLRDRDFRIQAAALEALAVIGDPAAIPALDDFLERELDGRLRRRGREIIRDLREGTAQAEQLTTMRDDVDRLKADAVRLRERLDQLSAIEATPAGAEATAPAKPVAAARMPRKRPAKKAPAPRPAAKRPKPASSRRR